MTKVLFLDIDGVVLPGRAYMLPNQTKPIVKTFDPCAVSMVNEACWKQKREIVVHSSWVKHMDREELAAHLYGQGIDTGMLHEDWLTDRNFHWRYDRVRDWLARHKECTDFVICDDEPAEKDDAHLVKHLILTDFDEGLTMKNFRQLLDGVYPRNDV